MAALMLLQAGAVSVFAATADGTDYVTADSNSRMPIPKAYVVIDEINNLGAAKIRLRSLAAAIKNKEQE